ncbi:competence damage-inducible protein A [mine drainage metagenome]|uniref:Competence damage-inducible protein A n=1 Tax=mine drainage metagenome TaxID=410659 RepID=T1BVR2_9ZZZZ
MERGTWIVAVGDELLSGHTADSNSHWLAQRLRQTPYPVRRMVVVGDSDAEIAEVMGSAVASGADRVFCCGGLGPTPDDRTVAALAAALGLPLREDAATLRRISQRLARLHQEGRIASAEPNSGHRKMALIPAGSLVLVNSVGLAPPLALPLPTTGEPRWLLVLPGVPAELLTIVEEEIVPVFCQGARAAVYAEERYSGVPESQFYPVLLRLAEEYPQVRFGSYPQAQLGDVIIRACAADGTVLERAMGALREQSPPSRS